jgi:hypothetical protein
MKKPAPSWFTPACKKEAAGFSSGAPVAGRSEKIVPIDTLVSMLEEPSSGSMAMARGACVERDRSVAHGVEEDVVGEDVEILLDVAIGIGAAGPGKGGAEHPLIDGVADIGSGLRQLADSRHHRGAQLVRRAEIGIQKSIERCRWHRNLPIQPPLLGSAGQGNENKHHRISKIQ